MLLQHVFAPERIVINLKSEEKEEVFEELADAFVSSVSGLSRAEIVAALQVRELKLSTGLGNGVAVLHIRMPGVDTVRGVIGTSLRGIDYDALDGKPVHLLFMLVVPEKDVGTYLDVLKKVAQLLNTFEFFQSLLNQRTREDLYSCMCTFENSLSY